VLGKLSLANLPGPAMLMATNREEKGEFCTQQRCVQDCFYPVIKGAGSLTEPAIWLILLIYRTSLTGFNNICQVPAGRDIQVVPGEHPSLRFRMILECLQAQWYGSIHRGHSEDYVLMIMIMSSKSQNEMNSEKSVP